MQWAADEQILPMSMTLLNRQVGDKGCFFYINNLKRVILYNFITITCL